MKTITMADFLLFIWLFLSIIWMLRQNIKIYNMYIKNRNNNIYSFNHETNIKRLIIDLKNCKWHQFNTKRKIKDLIFIELIQNIEQIKINTEKTSDAVIANNRAYHIQQLKK